MPGRNILFLTFAACVAYRRGIKHIIAGMCETDYSGYPDCRDDTIKSLQATLNLGMEARFVLHTPLMSGANAIHGVVIIGAIIVMGKAAPDDYISLILGFLAVVLGTLNVVGGFVVTDRMLEMFSKKKKK